MNFSGLSSTNRFTGEAHGSDAEFELLDDENTDLGLSKLQLDSNQVTGRSGERKGRSVRTDEVVDDIDIKGIRTLRQDIVSKYSSIEESRHVTSPPQVKIFYTSKTRPSAAILQSGDSVVEQSLVFWNKRSAKGSSGFFIETQASSEEHGSILDSNDRRSASLESNLQSFELFTPSKDFAALVYWGTMECLPDALPDLQEQELRALPRQTRSDLYREAADNPSALDLADLHTDDFDSLLSGSVHRVRCIGFRRIGVNTDLTGKFGWSRQKLSPGARTPLEPEPTAKASGSRRRMIQDMTTDLDALDIEPPVFRASKRRRDEESSIVPEFAIDFDVRPTKKKTRQLEVDLGLDAWEDVEEATVVPKLKKKERKMKKSRARRKRDKEVKEVAGMLNRLSMGQVEVEEDDGME
ncbi:hypothetical protein FRC00_009303, partial [Tulasnella sp. 408]